MLDDIHNYFPAFLYEQSRFQSVSDVFQYMNQQIDAHCNLFRRGLNQYNRRNPPVSLSRSQPRIITQEYVDIIPLFQQRARTSTGVGTGAGVGVGTGVGTGTGAGTGAGVGTIPLNYTFGQSLLSEYLTSIFQPPTNTMESVPIIPSVSQINASTSLESANLDSEDENCSICQEHYTEGQAIRTINHCEHKFHKNCIDIWFARNVHCPVCRYDIRAQD